MGVQLPDALWGGVPTIVFAVIGAAFLYWGGRVFVSRREHDEKHADNQARLTAIETRLNGMPTPEDWRELRKSYEQLPAILERVDWIKRTLENLQRDRRAEREE